nr:MAG TPA: hypothetical protein [Caudoviricetes sp.]
MRQGYRSLKRIRVELSWDLVKGNQNRRRYL